VLTLRCLEQARKRCLSHLAKMPKMSRKRPRRATVHVQATMLRLRSALRHVRPRTPRIRMRLPLEIPIPRSAFRPNLRFHLLRQLRQRKAPSRRLCRPISKTQHVILHFERSGPRNDHEPQHSRWTPTDRPPRTSTTLTRKRQQTRFPRRGMVPLFLPR
jgi:hypothetical protein